MNKRVIINADDFGITEGVNRGMIELANEGILTSTSVMTNIPHFQEIDSLKDKIGIGIHLNLSVGDPILSPEKLPTLVDEKGSFYEFSVLIKKAINGELSSKEIEAEFNAQISRLVDVGIKPSHVDSHESFMKYPYFIQSIRTIARKHNIRGVRTYSRSIFEYKRLLNPKRIIISLMLYYQKFIWREAGFHVTDKINSINKLNLDYNAAIKKLRDIFRNLPDGVLEVVVHPGYCSEDIALLGGYVKEREVELKALLSEEFKEIIHNSAAELISYNDI